MDSSAKYRKFAAHREEDYAKPKNKLRSFVVVLVAFVAVAALATGIGVGVSRRQTNGLTLITASPGEVQGKFYDSRFGEIYFHSTVNYSFVYLSITTNSEAIVYMQHCVELSMTMITATDINFLIMENQTSREYTDYVIPKNYTNLLETMMRRQEAMSDEILGQLDSRTVNETRQYSLESLAMSQEALLIIDAARDLENQEGSDTYPAIAPFYLLGMQLSKVRFSKGEVLSSSTPNSEATKEYRQKRSQPKIFCGQRNGSGICEPSACPSYTDHCTGMCGPGCNHCWSVVCKDCCIHEFCRTHDLCCGDDHWSWRCLAVIWKYPWQRFLHGQDAVCSDQYAC